MSNIIYYIRKQFLEQFPTYFKVENRKTYRWIINWWGNIKESDNHWLDISETMVGHGYSTPTLKEHEAIVPELYSCPLCQNTGTSDKNTTVPRMCECVRNPFSIVNKLL